MTFLQRCLLIAGLAGASLAPTAHGDTSARLDAEVAVRQTLIQVALAREPADLVLSGATVLNVFTSEWQPGQDIVIVDGRIAWVGATGAWPGKAAKTEKVAGLWAVPGFGESHKHIESSYLTPEYEAALVIPKGNTWTVEGSHELSNVVGEHNVSFWLAAEDAGSPLKIFPAIGSATPPTVYERAGGYGPGPDAGESERHHRPLLAALVVAGVRKRLGRQPLERR